MKTDKHTYPVNLHARKAAEGHVFITASVKDSMDAARSAEYVYVHIAHQLQIKGLEGGLCFPSSYSLRRLTRFPGLLVMALGQATCL